MFLLDPDAGRRRRALMRDQVTRGARRLATGWMRRLAISPHRAGGIAAAARGRWSAGSPVSKPSPARRGKLGRAGARSARDREERRMETPGAVQSFPPKCLSAVSRSERCGPHEGQPSTGGPMTRPRASPRRSQGRDRTVPEVLKSNWAPSIRSTLTAGLLCTGSGSPSAPGAVATVRDSHTAMRTVGGQRDTGSRPLDGPRAAGRFAAARFLTNDPVKARRLTRQNVRLLSRTPRCSWPSCPLRRSCES